jgi:hypothetical protein
MFTAILEYVQSAWSALRGWLGKMGRSEPGKKFLAAVLRALVECLIAIFIDHKVKMKDSKKQDKKEP